MQKKVWADQGGIRCRTRPVCRWHSALIVDHTTHEVGCFGRSSDEKGRPSWHTLTSKDAGAIENRLMDEIGQCEKWSESQKCEVTPELSKVIVSGLRTVRVERDDQWWRRVASKTRAKNDKIAQLVAGSTNCFKVIVGDNGKSRQSTSATWSRQSNRTDRVETKDERDNQAGDDDEAKYCKSFFLVVFVLFTVILILNNLPF